MLVIGVEGQNLALQLDYAFFEKNIAKSICVVLWNEVTAVAHQLRRGLLPLAEDIDEEIVSLGDLRIAHEDIEQLRAGNGVVVVAVLMEEGGHAIILELVDTEEMAQAVQLGRHVADERVFLGVKGTMRTL